MVEAIPIPETAVMDMLNDLTQNIGYPFCPAFTVINHNVLTVLALVAGNNVRQRKQHIISQRWTVLRFKQL